MKEMHPLKAGGDTAPNVVLKADANVVGLPGGSVRDFAHALGFKRQGGILPAAPAGVNLRRRQTGRRIPLLS